MASSWNIPKYVVGQIWFFGILNLSCSILYTISIWLFIFHTNLKTKANINWWTTYLLSFDYIINILTFQKDTTCPKVSYVTVNRMQWHPRYHVFSLRMWINQVHDVENILRNVSACKIATQTMMLRCTKLHLSTIAALTLQITMTQYK